MNGLRDKYGKGGIPECAHSDKVGEVKCPAGLLHEGDETMPDETKEEIRTLIDRIDDINFRLEEILMGMSQLDEAYQHLSDATDYIEHALNELDEIFL